MRYIFFICLSVIFVACTKNKVPDDILPPVKMESVFWDYIRADILAADMHRADSTLDPLKENIMLQKKVFAVHGITKEQFYNSYDYYTKHPELMTTILDSIIAKENRKMFKPAIKNIKKYEKSI